MKRGPHKKERMSLSAKGLLAKVRNVIANSIEDKRKSNRGCPQTISLVDAIMSAVAMFSLKSPSLLAFDESLMDPIVEHNLKSLYKIKKAPSDTRMREILDEISPRDLRKTFLATFQSVQRGKLLERYKFLGEYILSLDGTQIFESEKVHCKNCCEKHHRTGKISYYHQILSGAIVKPGLSQVIPLCPEPITKQDGSSKNDCELNSAYRFLSDLKREHPHLKLTITTDALFTNAPYIRKINEFGYNFITVAKATKNKSLFDWISGLELEEVIIKKGKNKYYFQFINNIPLNGDDYSPEINFFSCKATEIKGKKETNKQFCWVTSHKIDKNNVYSLMLAGRAKWKIENETFNTLKNQGYQLEHNFGHGKKNLHSVFANLLMLAFLMDQVQEAACGLFQAALAHKKSRRTLWERMRGFFYLVFVKDWKDLFIAMGADFKGLSLTIDTS